MLKKLTVTIIVFLIVVTGYAQPPIPGVIYPDFTTSPATISAGSAVLFNASVNGNSTPVRYFWNFGDGNTANTAATDVYHIFNTAGNYTIYLKAYTGYGDSGVIIRTLMVSPTASSPVTASFTYASPVYANSPVQFVDNSSTSSGVLSAYTWTIGPSVAATQNFVFSFPAYGTYEVVHGVSNNNGQQASVTKLVTVLPSAPIEQDVCSGENKFLLCYNQASVYQWQVSTDSGNSYQDITDADFYYSFTKTNGLLLNYTASSFNGNWYRCMADAVPGTVYKIRIGNQFTGIADSTWENPANWSCGVLPDEYTDVVINSGTVTVNSNASCRTLRVSTGASVIVTPGFTLNIAH